MPWTSHTRGETLGPLALLPSPADGTLTFKFKHLLSKFLSVLYLHNNLTLGFVHLTQRLVGRNATGSCVPRLSQRLGTEFSMSGIDSNFVLRL